jgi:hypothetical protein
MNLTINLTNNHIVSCSKDFSLSLALSFTTNSPDAYSRDPQLPHESNLEPHGFQPEPQNFEMNLSRNLSLELNKLLVEDSSPLLEDSSPLLEDTSSADNLPACKRQLTCRHLRYRQKAAYLQAEDVYKVCLI